MMKCFSEKKMYIVDSQIANLRKRCFQIKEILVNFKWNKKSYILSALCCFTYAAAKNSWRDGFNWCRKHVEELLSLFSEDTGSRKMSKYYVCESWVFYQHKQISREGPVHTYPFLQCLFENGDFCCVFKKYPRPRVAFLNCFCPSVRKRNTDWKRYHLWREHAIYWYPTP